MFIILIIIMINNYHLQQHNNYLTTQCTRAPSFQSVVITIEGNTVATDGSTRLSIAVDDGTNYIAGGTLGEDQYYATLQVTVEEDDGKKIIISDNLPLSIHDN
jgi:hypothetical protein